MIARFDRAQDVNGGNIGAGEGAIVHDLFHAGAGGGDLRGEIGQTAGTIADDGGETAQATVCDKAAFDHATQDIGIDIAPAEQKHDPFAGELRQLT